jgi:hypothetical protein
VKTVNIISWLAIAFALVIISVIVYWSIYPYKTVEFETPHKVLNENRQVEVGGELFHEVRYCKYTTVTPIISRYFEDTILYFLPVQVAVKNEVGCGVNIIQTDIPKVMPPGIYTVRTSFKYHINPIREIDVFTETEPFEIVEGGE